MAGGDGRNNGLDTPSAMYLSPERVWQQRVEAAATARHVSGDWWQVLDPTSGKKVVLQRASPAPASRRRRTARPPAAAHPFLHRPHCLALHLHRPHCLALHSTTPT